MTNPKCSPENCIPAVKKAKRMETPPSKLKGAIRIYAERGGEPVNALFRVSNEYALFLISRIKKHGWKEGM